jgi:hypothetical protein
MEPAMTTTPINPLSMMATAPLTTTSSTPTDSSSTGNWFDAMAQAWSKTLDDEANKISSMSDAIGGGNDDPQAITELTAETLRMSYLSDSSHTALTSVGTALDTMARKQ